MAGGPRKPYVPAAGREISVEEIEATGRYALKLYGGIISEVERGGEFLIRDVSGQITSFRMFL